MDRGRGRGEGSCGAVPWTKAGWHWEDGLVILGSWVGGTGRMGW